MARRAWGVCIVFGLGAVAATLPLTPARAHPHQFFTFQAKAVIDQSGRMTAIRTRWHAGEFFSISLAAGIGIDTRKPLSAEDKRKLDEEFAVNFTAYNWLTFVRQGGRDLQIGPPRDKRYRLVNEDFVIDWELPLSEPVSARDAPVELRFYDPGFLAKVTLAGSPGLTGAGAEGCRIAHEPFVADAAAQRELALLELLPIDATPDDPTVGRKFADRVEVRCDNDAEQS